MCPRSALNSGRPSGSAVVAAFGRLLAGTGVTRLDTFADPLAAQLLGPPFPQLERAARVLFRALPGLPPLLHRVSLGVTDLFALRSAWLDEQLGAERPRQLVILGAGLDSRAFRDPGLAQTVVFEVDRASAVAYKQRRVQARRPTAEGLHFVVVDLTSRTLGETLEAAGHRADVPTFWLAEGLLMYLSRPDLRRVLEALAGRSAPGSQIAATYVDRSRAGAVMGWVARRLGEPFQSDVESTELAQRVVDAGFEVQEDRALLDEGAEPWGASWLARAERVLLARRRPTTGETGTCP